MERHKEIERWIDTHANDMSVTPNLRNAETIREKRTIMKLLLGAIRTEYSLMDEADDEVVSHEPYEYDNEPEDGGGR